MIRNKGIKRTLLALLLAGIIALQPALPWGAASADARGQIARTVAFDAAESTPDAATPTPDATAPTPDPSALPTPDSSATPDPSAGPTETPASDPSAAPSGDPDSSPSAAPSETPAETELPMLFGALEATGTTYDLETIARSISLSIEVNGVPYVPGMAIARNSAIKLVLIYRLQNEGGSNDLTALDTLRYVFPEELNMTNVSGEMYDGAVAAGTFQISNDVLTMQLYQAYLDANGTSEMKGTLRLNGSFDLAEIADGNEHVITFPGSGTITVTFEAPKVTAKKTQSYSSSSNEVTYSVQVSADANVTNVEIVDTFGGNLTYVAGSVSKPEVTVAVDPVNPQIVTFTVPFVGPSGSYTFTYKGRIADAVFQQNGATVTDGLKNTIAWYESAGVPKTSSATTNISKNWVDKSAAWANLTTGLINWTVTVNNNYPLNMSGITITDTFSANQALVGSVAVSGSVDGALGNATPTANGFTYLITSTSAQRYTFTYQTQINANYLTDPGSFTFSNTAGFTAWDKTYSDDASLTRTNGLTGVDLVDKSVSNVDTVNYTADWRITVHTSLGGASVPKTLTDELSPRSGRASWILQDTLSVKYDDGTDLAGGAYTVAWAKYSPPNDAYAYRFTLTFDGTKLTRPRTSS